MFVKLESLTKRLTSKTHIQETILVEGLMKNICVKLFFILGQWFRRSFEEKSLHTAHAGWRPVTKAHFEPMAQV